VAQPAVAQPALAQPAVAVVVEGDSLMMTIMTYKLKTRTLLLLVASLKQNAANRATLGRTSTAAYYAPVDKHLRLKHRPTAALAPTNFEPVADPVGCVRSFIWANALKDALANSATFLNKNSPAILREKLEHATAQELPYDL
jgi:hypothetical protein